MTAKAAAQSMGVSVSSYSQHESGFRGFKADQARVYAQHFHTTPEWLLYGRGQLGPPATTVPLVGSIGAASAALFFFKNNGALDRVDPPPGADANTRALEIRTEDGLGAPFDRWVAFFSEADRGPVNALHMGQLCLCGLPDGRVLVKKLQRSKTGGLYHLTSGTAEPLLDQEVEWAARIICLKPQ